MYGFPSKLQALQFEWAWQNPHASRHLHAEPLSTSKPLTAETAPAAAQGRPSAQFPKSSLSNRPQSKVQVLQFMLTSKPWTYFNLQVMLFSQDAQLWWETARNRLGPVFRTEAALKKWEKTKPAGDPWGTQRGARLNQARVILRVEGVDGDRLVRQGVAEQGIEKVQIQDGQWLR